MALIDMEVLIRKGTKANLGGFEIDNHADNDIIYSKEVPATWGYNESKANHLAHHGDLTNWLDSTYIVVVTDTPEGHPEALNETAVATIFDEDGNPTHRVAYTFNKAGLPAPNKAEIDNDSITTITSAQFRGLLIHKVSGIPHP